MHTCGFLYAVTKVETPMHDKVVDNELEVAQNFTWAVLGMEDGNF